MRNQNMTENAPIQTEYTDRRNPKILFAIAKKNLGYQNKWDISNILFL